MIKKLFFTFLTLLFSLNLVSSNYIKAMEIKVGDVVVLVSDDANKELGEISTTSTKYGIGINFITTPAGVMPLTVVTGNSEGTFAFKTSDDKYLYWSSGNSLATNTTLSDNTSWTVSIDESGYAAIKNASDAARQIWWNISSPRFACYTGKSHSTNGSGYYCPSLYVKKETGEPSITANDVNLGYVLAEPGANFEKDIVVNIIGSNLTEAIDYVADDNLTVTGTLTEEGGSLNVHVSASVGDFDALILLASGAIEQEVHICGNVVERRGNGTSEEPYSPSTARALALNGSTASVYIKGFVSEIATAYNSTYNNISFWLDDTINGGQVFEAYRAVCQTGENAPEVGDSVLLNGTLKNFNGIAETETGCTFIILNGDTTPVDTTPVVTPETIIEEIPDSWIMAEMNAGTNGSTCTVSEQEGIKVGTSSKGGDMTITIPANTIILHFYASAWNGVNNLSLELTGAELSVDTINLIPNTGIAGGSGSKPSYILAKGTNEGDYRFDIEVSNVEVATEITLTTLTSKRFVLWKAACEIKKGPATDITNIKDSNNSKKYFNGK